jgi:hypothetical protein
MLTEKLQILQEFTNSLIPVCHRYATIFFYLVYFKYLLIYQYSDFANEYKQIAIQSLSTIHTIWSGIR